MTRCHVARAGARAARSGDRRGHRARVHLDDDRRAGGVAVPRRLRARRRARRARDRERDGSRTGPDRSARCCRSAPLRAIGIISYGLYLWHWPIYVVPRRGLAPTSTVHRLLALRLAVTVRDRGRVVLLSSSGPIRHGALPRLVGPGTVPADAACRLVVALVIATSAHGAACVPRACPRGELAPPPAAGARRGRRPRPTPAAPAPRSTAPRHARRRLGGAQPRSRASTRASRGPRFRVLGRERARLRPRHRRR